jgi:hypothetical protein
MNPITSLKGTAGRILRQLSPSLDHQLRSRFSKNYWANWPERTRKALACPDNDRIPRVSQAGQIEDGFQVMHNGIKVLVGSYYGQGPIELLRKNRGVHEPQEEYLFQEILKTIPPGAVMVELGAYWGFYSIWFCREVPKGKAFLVEPEKENLMFGQRNFEANNLSGDFKQALVGRTSGQTDSGLPIICVDDFLAQRGIQKVCILHSDIQGHEFEMLQGAEKTLKAGAVDYLFISTHSERLHHDCASFLIAKGYLAVGSVTPSESYSLDGILVMRHPRTPVSQGTLRVSKRLLG